VAIAPFLQTKGCIRLVKEGGGGTLLYKKKSGELGRSHKAYFEKAIAEVNLLVQGVSIVQKGFPL